MDILFDMSKNFDVMLRNYLLILKIFVKNNNILSFVIGGFPPVYLPFIGCTKKHLIVQCTCTYTRTCHFEEASKITDGFLCCLHFKNHAKGLRSALGILRICKNFFLNQAFAFLDLMFLTKCQQNIWNPSRDKNWLNYLEQKRSLSAMFLALETMMRAQTPLSMSHLS